uniref:Amidase domain-containing protein n=1 Tax=Clastoptera arizonana TaxID=38151 RepID=A0A1B6DIM6_9HEMI
MEIGIRIVGALQILISWLTSPIYYLLSLNRVKQIPQIRNPILLESASSLARKIRNQELTSEQVVRAFIIRCKEVNPLINAIVEERFTAALGEAHDVDVFILSGVKTTEEMERDTPFLGVPFTVKESNALKGMSQAVGCLPRAGMKADRDGVAVENLRKAGGIPILVSNTPELCLCWESNNLITGRSNNPYDLSRTPGGSSGGEAALISSGASVFGVASDIAGSIRIPSMFTGLFGHKPTPGFVSLNGHVPNSGDNFEKFLTVGPIVRYAEDLKPIMKIMAGDKAKDLRLDEEVDISKVRVVFKDEMSKSKVMVPVAPEINKAMHKAIDHLSLTRKCTVQDKNAELEEILNDTVEISCSVFFQMEGIPDLMSMSANDDPKNKKNPYVELFKSIFGLSEYSLAGILFTILHKINCLIPQSKTAYYNSRNEELKAKLIDILGEDGVFFYPTHPIPAYHHNQFTMKTSGVAYSMIFNTLGFPSTHVPMGLNKDGLPIGFQVIGAPKQDRLCLAMAKELESAFGGWVAPS